jgi:amidase
MLGSDLGGSLRAPAHYRGVYAHKPTLGLVPRRGQTPPGVPPLPRESDLAVVGPMTRSAADLALALDVIAGPDEERAGKLRAFAAYLPISPIFGTPIVKQS